MSKKNPPLGSSQPGKLKFAPGDRVLVRVACALSPDQVQNVRRSVIRFSGEDIRPLVVDCRHVGVWRVRGEEIKELCGPQHSRGPMAIPGVAQLACEIIDIRPNDKLMVTVPRVKGDLHRKRITDTFRQWTGPDVEVVVLERKSGG